MKRSLLRPNMTGTTKISSSDLRDKNAVEGFPSECLNYHSNKVLSESRENA
jgi:hypothetical protein